jgi:hypothetical protein
MVLPNSRINIWSGWTGFDYPSGVREGLGYDPDYYSFDGDALAAALDYLDHTNHARR